MTPHGSWKPHHFRNTVLVFVGTIVAGVVAILLIGTAYRILVG